MRIEPRFRLTTKILLLALCNVAVLGMMCLALLRWQLGQEFESFLMATARERIVSQTRSIALEMRDVERSTWTQILSEHSARNGVTFALYKGDGEWIAGPALSLPHEVKERMFVPGGREGGREGGWPREGPPPMLRKDDPRKEGPGRGLNAYGGGPFLISAKSDSKYNFWVAMRTFVPPGGEGERPSRGILIIASPTLLTNPFFFQLRPWILIGLAAVIVSVLCWVPLVRGLTRSIHQMTSATARIAEGDFDAQVSVKRHDELGLLGASINRMAARLGAFTHGQKRFLGDVAHELRSPLGRMQLALGILDRKVDESGEAYVKDLAEDVRIMSGLTDGLLEFAKAEMRPETIALGPVNVADVVWRAVRAEQRPGIAMEVKVDPLLMVKGETEYLFRALANVIRNAVRYAGPEGPIAVGANSARGEVSVVVTDAGPGVPDESVDRIFEPFFRIDDARDRESGGAGLGLAIVKSCVEACGGRVSCRNRKPRGLEVSLVFEAA
ncbi:sensor histidine kinase [Bryobacter aggregatus]|uniref:sensor histidine kinase n=1 Tax=Bryobacter aggregatus TaxID=360054 RepID=UPI00068C294C|nr:HAMP domain-containing sensor histidine kinase [Bryobacter aggregatus]